MYDSADRREAVGLWGRGCVRTWGGGPRGGPKGSPGEGQEEAKRRPKGGQEDAKAVRAPCSMIDPSVSSKSVRGPCSMEHWFIFDHTGNCQPSSYK